MPLTWEELEGAHPLDFRITNAAERLKGQAIAGATS
jgi:DNA primase